MDFKTLLFEVRELAEKVEYKKITLKKGRDLAFELYKKYKGYVTCTNDVVSPEWEVETAMSNILAASCQKRVVKFKGCMQDAYDNIKHASYLKSTSEIEAVEQKITSKATSVNKVAGFYKKAIKAGLLGGNELVLDYGVGKHLDYLKAFADDSGFEVLGYDPYHLTTCENSVALSPHNLSYVNFIACNNVLNVLQDNTLNGVIGSIAALCRVYDFPAYFTVYEGDRTGIGRETKKDCYQRNEKVGAYIGLLGEYFKDITLKNGIIKGTV